MYCISTHKSTSLVVKSFYSESSGSRSVLLSPTPVHTGVSGKASTAVSERVDLLDRSACFKNALAPLKFL